MQKMITASQDLKINDSEHLHSPYHVRLSGLH